MEYKPVVRDCDNCELAQTNSEVREQCSVGLVVNNGVGFCSTENDLKYQFRDGASVTSVSSHGGVIIRYAEDGYLTKGTFQYKPSRTEKILARIGIRKTLVCDDSRP